MANSSGYLLQIVRGQKEGRAGGVCSLCSAHPFVLSAALKQALPGGAPVCIESTSNQVNQFGGYTGMAPADFVRFVHKLAAELDFPKDRILLGGDHLGPHVWRKKPAQPAMAKACELVRSCVLAGYTKIHLDASMRCAGDPGAGDAPLDDELVARRAAEMCAAAEAAHAELPPDSPRPVYVIGTEVPPPGGEQQAGAGPAVTKAADVERTISVAQKIFKDCNLGRAWERVIAVVVQPGVEFADAHVFEYQRAKASALKKTIQAQAGLVYEAHSTDYQAPRALRELVEDQFAVLKVGPWLTFAFREAAFALARIEKEWLGARRGVPMSDLAEVLERAMLADPRHWKPYYHGDKEYLHFARNYSFSDRSRYYWPRPEVAAALDRLLQNLSAAAIPLTLLSQYLPAQYDAVRAGEIPASPKALIYHRIQQVTGIYAHACRRGT